MLGNRTGLPSLNGMRRRRDGIGTGVYPPGWEKKVKVINAFAPVKKGPTKLKFASKPKSTTPRPPIDVTPTSRTRGSERKTTPYHALAIERRVHHF